MICRYRTKVRYLGKWWSAVPADTLKGGGKKEMGELTHFSLFSGIEGIGRAAELAGFKSTGQVEINPFSLKILNKRYPDVPKWQNIKHISRRKVLKRLYKEGLLYDRNDPISLLSGGFPCQDLSVAGKQAGLEGERSGLWFEMLRVISELRPRWVLAENVRGAVNLALDTVKMGLEAEGYKVWPFVISASAFGAPHKRERLLVVGCREDVANAVTERFQGSEWTGTFCEQGTATPEPVAECGEVFDGMMWPTPIVCGNYNRKGASANSGDGLATAVRLWPTPRASSHRSPCVHGEGGVDIQTAVAKTERGVEETNGRKIQNSSGSLNPDWVEILMNFPIGWTNPDCDEPEPWPGWPAPMGMKMWATPSAWDCKGTNGGGQDRSLRTDIYNIKSGLTEAGQYPYEPPRVAKGVKYRADRIKALGNAVVPWQVLPFIQAIYEIESHLV